MVMVWDTFEDWLIDSNVCWFVGCCSCWYSAK